MFDCLVSGGMVHDGTGGKPFRADIAVENGRIAAVGNLDKPEAKESFDARGYVVLPGFIDVHTHSDMRVFQSPDRAEALCQGITTEIVSSCGIGLFPLADADYGRMLSGIFGTVPSAFSSCEKYLSALPSVGVNVAVQLAHSPLRYRLCGFRDEALPLDEARKQARRAFEEGACALSTGLAYYPAAFGDTREVAELCKVAAEFDAPVCVHQRTALRKEDPTFDSREEVLEFARQSGIRVHFSHYRPVPATAGKLDTVLAPIERGLSEGLRVTADFYPYPVGAGYTAVNLPMKMMEGGFSEVMKRLRNPGWRRRLLEYWKENPAKLLSKGVVIHAPNHPEYWNRTYREIAQMRGQEVPEMLIDLLIEEELQVAFHPEADFPEASLSALDRDFTAMMRKPYFMFGSDTLPGHAFPHPRSYGAFARLVRLAVRDKVPLSRFARQASGLPAELFGLRGRGVIAKGNRADLCVFRPSEISDEATFDCPRQYAKGMALVAVNGKIAVRNGKTTGILGGEAIRRGI